MERRHFIGTVIAGTAGAALGAGAVAARGAAAEGETAAAAAPVRRELLMTLGCQSRNGVTQENLEFLARHGVYHMDPGAPATLPDGRWDLDDALRQQEEASKYGVRVDAYHLPLSSAGIDRVRTPNIMLGKSPERDREIEIIQQMIEVAGRAGVRALLYNTIILPILRTGQTPDPTRGNARYSTWNYDEAVSRGLHLQRTIAGEVSLDEIYERITYFLDRVLPVAEEYNVRLANHIADPPVAAGYMGVTRWNSPDVFEGIQRFANLYDSPCHGFNMCLGSTAEGLRNPKEEIVPVLQWMGERKKIFNIHMRNIKGGWNNFQEVYPDNGDMDFFQVMLTLRDVGYDGMIMPDHVPSHAAEGARDQAFAFAYGYIRAMLQAVAQV